MKPFDDPRPVRRASAVVALALAAVPAAAATCDELVAGIDARIRANGVSEFTVAAVDVAASAPGRQVGTCDAGRKKIMYVRGAVGAAMPAAGAASARAPRPRVITECADGRVIEEGTCGKK